MPVVGEEVVVVFAFVGLLSLGFLAAMIAALVFWVLKVVEVAQIPDPQYRAAGTDKVVWMLVVVLVGFVGALIWQFAKRDEVLRVARHPGVPGVGAPPIAPPGWYPEQGTRWLTYWDGYRWTGARHPPWPIQQPVQEPQPTHSLPDATDRPERPGPSPRKHPD
jgi:hypothetical protein